MEQFADPATKAGRNRNGNDRKNSHGIAVPVRSSGCPNIRARAVPQGESRRSLQVKGVEPAKAGYWSEHKCQMWSLLLHLNQLQRSRS